MSDVARPFNPWGDGGAPHPGAEGWDGQRPAWRARLRYLTEDPGPIMLLACAPQWGKDRATRAIGLDLLLRLYRERIASPPTIPLLPTVNAWLVAPTREDYAQAWREWVEGTRDLHPVVNRSTRSIILFPDPDRIDTTGIHVKLKTGWDPDRMVAEPLDLLMITEAAKLPTSTHAQALSRLVSAGRKGWELYNGTPTEDPAQWYVELFRRGQEGDPGVIFVNEPSWASPFMCKPEQKAKLKGIKARVSRARWNGTWRAQLIQDADRPFRNLRDLATEPRRGPVPGGFYVKFYDPAGTGSENNALSAFLVLPGEIRQVELWWWNRNWSVSKSFLREAATRYPGVTLIDNNGRIAMETEIRDLLEPLGEEVEAQTWTNTRKVDMVDNAVRIFEARGSIAETGQVFRILHPQAGGENPVCATDVQYRELMNYRRLYTRTGKITYGHTVSGKLDSDDPGTDDCVTCILGSLWYAVREGTAATADDVPTRW